MIFTQRFPSKFESEKSVMTSRHESFMKNHQMHVFMQKSTCDSTVKKSSCLSRMQETCEISWNRVVRFCCFLLLNRTLTCIMAIILDSISHYAHFTYIDVFVPRLMLHSRLVCLLDEYLLFFFFLKWEWGKIKGLDVFNSFFECCHSLIHASPTWVSGFFPSVVVEFNNAKRLCFALEIYST